MVGVAALAGYWAGGRGDDMTTTALVAGYQRAALSGQQVDVASSDRHTVKPWFTTHAPLGALVLDLVAEGYPLIGGRLDVVDGKPVPTLVYRRGGHIIAVSEFPSSAAVRSERARRLSTSSVGATASAPMSRCPTSKSQNSTPSSRSSSKRRRREVINNTCSHR